MGNFLLIFGKPRYLGIAAFSEETPVKRGEKWIVQSVRGKEIAVVAGEISETQEKVYREIKRGDNQDNSGKGGEPPLQDLECLEPATEADLELAGEQRADEEKVLLRAREILRDHNLSMKLVDVEYLLDRKKLFFYFTAEQRIDFRAFVRDLAREFKTRIELRQIGIRDEAKVVEGLAPCGNPCCCSYWLNRFAPICIRMVKEQNLALNPTKISGLCGRLMCCMSYEHQNYKRLWDHLPNPGSKIRAPQGTFILAGVDVHAEAVRILTPDRSELLVPVDRFQEFRDTVMDGKTWETETPERELSEPSAEPAGERLRRVSPQDKAAGETRKGKRRSPRTGDKSASGEKKQRTGDKAASAGKKQAAAGTPAPGEEPAKKRPPRKRRRRRKKPADGGAAATETRTPSQKKDDKPRKPEPNKGAGQPAGPDGDAPKKRSSRRRRRRKRPQDPSAAQQGNGSGTGRKSSGKPEQDNA